MLTKVVDNESELLVSRKNVKIPRIVVYTGYVYIIIKMSSSLLSSSRSFFKILDIKNFSVINGVGA